VPWLLNPKDLKDFKYLRLQLFLGVSEKASTVTLKKGY
jgi:hypothetical protein